jgi:hypothetical protein
MKKVLFFSTFFFSISFYSFSQKISLPGQENKLPISFTENKGQVSDQNGLARPDVLYSGNTGQMIFHLRKNGISYQLQHIDSWRMKETTKGDSSSVPNSITTYRVDLNWLGINSNYSLSTDAALTGYTNYYLSVCPDGITGVKSYTGVILKNIYNNVDLHYYQKNGELKYDYIIAPNADYKQIQLQVSGAEIEKNPDGSLKLITPLGEIEEGAPVVFQNGKQLSARWIITNNILSFDISNYDSSMPVIIDPFTRVWGTYYADIATDDGLSCSTDKFGNVYHCGTTVSTSQNMLATSGAHQTTGGGFWDAYLVKFDVTGARIWGTYYGDNGDDYGNSCASDSLGNVYLTGNTQGYSNTVIATPGSQQPVYGGSNYDAFLVKFNAAGVRQWGTYYGGTGIDNGNSCAVDKFGYVYLAGTTGSGTAISTPGTQQPICAGGDAFLAKFDGNGVRIWGTYYGGTGQDYGNSCVVNSLGEILLCGTTTTPTSSAIASVGCHQGNYGGNASDAYLVKFNSNGIRIWGTYYGGTSQDEGTSCAADDSTGDIYITGWTWSTGAIATPGAHQSVKGSTIDAFLVKFNDNGVRQWGTYYGGSGQEYGRGCSVDISSNVYMVGETNTPTAGIIATPGSQQTIFGGGWDGYMVMFNSAGVRQYGTYYGGGSYDYTRFCETDQWGSVYIGGQTLTYTGTAIATPGSFQSAGIAGAEDAYIVKFNDCVPVSINLTSQSDATCYGSGSGSAIVAASGGSGFSYFWSPAGGNSDTAIGLTAGTYTCTAINSCGNGATQIVTISQPGAIGTTLQASPNHVCPNGSSTISVSATGGSGPLTYNWMPNSNTTISFTDSPSSTTNYIVTVTDSIGCFTTDSILVTVDALPIIQLGNDTMLCGTSFLLNAQNAGSTFLWSTNSTSQTINVTQSGTYNVLVTNSNGCSSSDTINVILNSPPVVTFSVPFDSICTTDASLQLVASPVGGTFSGNGVNGNLFDPSLSGIGEQTITYSYTDMNLCSASMNDSLYVDLCTGIISTESSSPFVYFDSNKGQIIIVLKEESTIELFNSSGQIVFSKRDQSGIFSIGTSEFSNGVYMLRVIGKNDNVHQEKILLGK